MYLFIFSINWYLGAIFKVHTKLIRQQQWVEGCAEWSYLFLDILLRNNCLRAHIIPTAYIVFLTQSLIILTFEGLKFKWMFNFWMFFFFFFYFITIELLLAIIESTAPGKHTARVRAHINFASKRSFLIVAIIDLPKIKVYFKSFSLVAWNIHALLTCHRCCYTAGMSHVVLLHVHYACEIFKSISTRLSWRMNWTKKKEGVCDANTQTKIANGEINFEVWKFCRLL